MIFDERHLEILQAAVDGKMVEMRAHVSKDSTGWVQLSLEGTVRQLLNGRPPTSFRIDRKITKEEAETALEKLRQYNGNDDAYFTLTSFLEQCK